MQMHDLLPPFLSYIELKLVSRDTHLAAEITSKEKESSNRIPVGILQIGDGLYVALRDQEHMDPGFRM